MEDMEPHLLAAADDIDCLIDDFTTIGMNFSSRFFCFSFSSQMKMSFGLFGIPITNKIPKREVKKMQKLRKKMQVWLRRGSKKY